MAVRARWVWMPHPGHLIVSHECRFHLTTCVGDYLVSTVGEWVPGESVREIFAESRGVTLSGRGDARQADYLDKVGFYDVGCDRKYESMVFPAKPQPHARCCPFTVANWSEVEMQGYNDAGEAAEGHMALCLKWADRKRTETT